MSASPEAVYRADSRRVCVDASLVIALLAPERFSQAALTLWEGWLSNDLEISAPRLLYYEAASALYRKAYQGLISWADEARVLSQLVDLDFTWVEPPGAAVRASELAREFNRPNAYDAFYLALAESLGCPLWTGDERLYNAVHQRFDLIHWLGEIRSEG